MGHSKSNIAKKTRGCARNISSKEPHKSAIYITVGKAQQTFTVDESIVCDSSEFFQRALKPEWASMRDRRNVFHRTEEYNDPEIFAIYADWLNTREVLKVRSSPQQDITRLVKAYVIGDELLDSWFKDAVITTLVEIMSQPNGMITPGMNDINIAYDQTPPSSPLRKLICHVHASVSELGTFVTIENFEQYPHEFLADTTRALWKTRKYTEENRQIWITKPKLYLDKRRG